MAAEYYRADRSTGEGDRTFDLHAVSGNLCRCTGYRPIRDAASGALTTIADGARCNLASQQQAVVGAILAAWGDEVVRRAERIRLGGPFAPDAETGPLISAEHREKVERYVAAGVAEGATLRCGGRRPGGGRGGRAGVRIAERRRGIRVQ